MRWRSFAINWDECHEVLAAVLRNTPLGSDVFDRQERRQIQDDVARLRDFEHRETGDEPFDRLTDRVVEWSPAHPDRLQR